MNSKISGKALAQKLRAKLHATEPIFDLKKAFDFFQVQIEPSLNQPFQNITQNQFGFVIETSGTHVDDSIFNKVEKRFELAQMLGELLYKVIDTNSPEHYYPTFRSTNHQFDAQDFAHELLVPEVMIQDTILGTNLNFEDLAYKFQVTETTMQNRLFRLEYQALRTMAKDRQLIPQ